MSQTLTDQPNETANPVDLISKAIQVTKSLFPGQILVESEDDPEIAGLTYVVFNVTSAADTKKVIDRRLKWHERMSEIGADASRLKLSVDVRQ